MLSQTILFCITSDIISPFLEEESFKCVDFTEGLKKWPKFKKKKKKKIERLLWMVDWDNLIADYEYI